MDELVAEVELTWMVTMGIAACGEEAEPAMLGTVEAGVTGRSQSPPPEV